MPARLRERPGCVPDVHPDPHRGGQLGNDGAAAHRRLPRDHGVLPRSHRDGADGASEPGPCRDSGQRADLKACGRRGARGGEEARAEGAAWAHEGDLQAPGRRRQRSSDPARDHEGHGRAHVQEGDAGHGHRAGGHGDGLQAHRWGPLRHNRVRGVLRPAGQDEAGRHANDHHVRQVLLLRDLAPAERGDEDSEDGDRGQAL
mmetsp:Transcript_3356/g.9059  ORF Transcript_3356/g.9059 Transcript_3356/m.9059 type:complete len:202 (+) Transcript_3356:828-1433(+)